MSTHLLPRLHPERCCKAWCRETPLRDRSPSGEFEQKCEQNASDFESRQQLRAEEIVALEKANEIISSGAVAGNAEKHLPTLLQTSSFAQLRVDLSTQAQSRVARYLSAQANKLNSRVLSALATRVADDPFHKVKEKRIKRWSGAGWPPPTTAQFSEAPQGQPFCEVLPTPAVGKILDAVGDELCMLDVVTVRRVKRCRRRGCVCASALRGCRDYWSHCHVGVTIEGSFEGFSQPWLGSSLRSGRSRVGFVIGMERGCGCASLMHAVVCKGQAISSLRRDAIRRCCIMAALAAGYRVTIQRHCS